MSYLAAVFDADGYVVDLDEALEHLEQHGADDEECGDCAREVIVCTGKYRDHVASSDTRPSTWYPAEILVDHDDLSSMAVREAVVRIQQAKLIAAALNEAAS